MSDTITNVANVSASSHTGVQGVDNVLWGLPYYAKVILCIIYALIFLLGVFGNAIVICTLGFSRRRLNRRRYGFIISLATTDLLASVAMPFIMMNDVVSGFKWHLGKVCCAVLPGMNILFLFTSAWLLMAIAWERMRLVLNSCLIKYV